MNLDTWAATVEWQLIDRDAAYGAQCWDLAADYAERVVGCPLADFWTLWDESSPDHTLVSSMWLYWPVKPGITAYFARYGRTEPIRAGDVLIWARSPGFPASHITVALEDAPAGAASVLCMTQNPGPAHRARLTTSGLLGLLRPLTNMEDDMYSDADRNRDQITYQRLNNMEKAAITRDRRLVNMEGALIRTLTALGKITAAGGSPEAAALAAELERTLKDDFAAIPAAVADEQAKRLKS